ncbi:MAG: phenylacetic acid degradation bifunctional protein PaaZ [Saprospiraceae bacterium]
MKLSNYILGAWAPYSGEGFAQYNAVNGELIGTVGSEGLDYNAMYDYARQTGGKVLRKMTFQERGRMIKSLAFYLLERKERYYSISYQSGATRLDSWIDIEGGIGTLFAYASLRRQFPDKPFHVEGAAVRLSKDNGFIGHHILSPKPGVAVHINAFNFPIWGMLEKLSSAWMGGMPAIVKPSEITSYITEAMVRDIHESGLIPDGALQLVCGNGHGILLPAGMNDVIAFTGSASTGKKLKALPPIIENSVPFHIEADSLNAIVLGPDAVPGTAEFDLLIKEVRKEVVTKTGQKCTAIRRIIVPSSVVQEVQRALANELSKTKIGDPQTEGVRMGSLVSRIQLEKVKHQVQMLAQKTPIVYGDLEKFDVTGATKEKGAFLSPILMLNERPFEYTDTHNVEAFGPVCTLMPYDSLEEAIELANMGKGSLVSTIVTYNQDVMNEYVYGAAAYHGRILILNRESAKESTGHGSPMPLMMHGGPGRAGGSEELGGIRGVLHYMQRTAIQGHPSAISRVTGVYQQGAAQHEEDKHPFKKHFEELSVGDTLITAKHTVSEADISNFANVSGDNFYAHMDATALEGTPFTGRVAHGYFVLSKAAGLFVDAKKGPVLLNYGLDECRFTKPVYPGMTIGVRFTCKEKIDQEKRSEDDIAKGIVKWLVDVYDETGETVAIATILTMVRKLNQA